MFNSKGSGTGLASSCTRKGEADIGISHDDRGLHEISTYMLPYRISGPGDTRHMELKGTTLRPIQTNELWDRNQWHASGKGGTFKIFDLFVATF